MINQWLAIFFTLQQNLFERGERTFVCEKTFNILKQAPYKEVFEFIDENENLINKSECCDTLCGC